MTALYQAVTIPIELAFEFDVFNSYYMVTIKSLIDLIFVIDIIMNFRTTYIDPQSGEECLDFIIIGKNYIKSGQFLIDILSTVPIDQIYYAFLKEDPPFILELFGCLKLLRLQRVSSFITEMNYTMENKAVFKVIYLILVMTLYIHINACVWYYIIKEEEIWVPNLDFIHFGTPMIYDYYSDNPGRQYLTSLYTSFYLFGVGEVVPRTTIENLVSIILLVVSSNFNGFVIGNMALYLIELEKNNKEF